MWQRGNMAGIKFGAAAGLCPWNQKKILATWGARMTDQQVPYFSVLSIIFRTLTMEPVARLEVVTDRCSMRRQLPLPQTCFTSRVQPGLAPLLKRPRRTPCPLPVRASSPRDQHWSVVLPCLAALVAQDELCISEMYRKRNAGAHDLDKSPSSG